MAMPISCRTDAIAAHSLRKIGSLAAIYGMAAVGATLKVGYPSVDAPLYARENVGVAACRASE